MLGGELSTAVRLGRLFRTWRKTVSAGNGRFFGGENPPQKNEGSTKKTDPLGPRVTLIWDQREVGVFVHVCLCVCAFACVFACACGCECVCVGEGVGVGV